MAYSATDGAATIVNWNTYLKNMWHQGRINDMAARGQPFFAMVPKKEDFFGKWKDVVVDYGNPMGASHTFTKSQDNARTSQGVQFNVTRTSDFGTVYINNETIEASQNDAGALIKSVDKELSGIMRTLAYRLGHELYRKGGGTRAQFGTPVVPGGGADDYLPLSTVRDVRFFEKNMTLKAGTTDGTTATTFRTTPATAVVKRVERSGSTAGRLYFPAGTFTGTNWASGDYLSVDGDIDATTLLGKGAKGLEAWIPLTRPSAGESYFGVDRSVDSDRLAGLTYDGTGSTLENALEMAAALTCEAGGMPDVAFMSPRTFAKLSISLGSRRIYGERAGFGSAANIGFKSIQVAADSGAIDCISDRNCPDNVIWLLTLDSWCFHTLLQGPRVQVTGDGLTKLRVANADDTEIRAIWRGNLWTDAPGWNCRIAVAS
jgi:hypothetical protein